MSRHRTPHCRGKHRQSHKRICLTLPRHEEGRKSKVWKIGATRNLACPLALYELIMNVYTHHLARHRNENDQNGEKV